MNKSKNTAICCLFVILLLLSLDGFAFAAYSIDQYAEIVAGDNYTVGREIDGSLWAWGNNTSGQLGDGTTVNRLTPVQIGKDTWVFITAGYGHTAGIRADGTLWAWGYNFFGQLGDGTTVDKLAPVQIGTDTDWVFIAAGNRHTIGIKADGTLWAWGYNFFGQLGDGTTVDKLAPVQIGTATDWFSIAAGDNHTIGLKLGGTLWAWGYNNHGQLGDGTIVDKHAPVQIGTDNTWDFTAAGYAHTAGIKENGTLWTWGYNNRGQLGDGTVVEKHAPLQIGTDDDGWFTVAAGFGHTAATKTDGTLWAWGYNNHGQLGDGTAVEEHAPLQIGTDDDSWFSVVTGNNHTAGIKTDLTLWTWGYNAFGQLGDGTTADLNTPNLVIQDRPLGDITAPAAGPLVVSNATYNNFVDGTFDLSATFTENETTVTSCQYCVTTDGTCDTEWAPATVSGSSPTWTCRKTGISRTNGQSLSLNMRATSSGGIGTGGKITKTVDASAPTTTNNSTSAWTNMSPVAVTLSATDAGGSGNAAGYPKYCVDTANTCTPATSYSSAFNITCASGSICTQYVRYYSVDNVGNAETVKSSTVKQDVATPPVTTATASGYTFGIWTSSASVAVTLSATDAGGSGNAAGYPKYCVDTANTCTPATSYSSAFNITCASGSICTQYVRYYSVDNVGNAETVKSSTVKQDVATPPVTTATASGYTFGIWTSSASVAVTLSATDAGGSGNAAGYPKYCVDTANTCTPATSYSSAFNITCASGSICTQYVRYYSVDNVGNAETVKSSTVKQDVATPPVTTATASGYTFGIWTSSASVAVTLSATDAGGSGNAAGYPKYCVDTANTCTPATSYSSAFNITCASGSICTQYVRYYSVDNVGNAETVKSSTVKQDVATPPVTTATASGYTFGIWTSSASVAVTLSATDAGGSGNAAGYPKYCVDTANTCTPATSYSSAFNITCASGSICTQYVRYYSVDNVGNAETVKSSTVNQNLTTYTVFFSFTGSGAITCTPASVSLGGSFDCTLAPGSGYHLESLLDNTVDVTARVSGTHYTVTNVSADHTVQARFRQNLTVLRLWGTNNETWYTLIQSAYDEASSGDDILTLASDFSENLEFDQPVTITLQGGCSQDFNIITGWTVLNGKLTISNGTVIIENLIIQ